MSRTVDTSCGDCFASDIVDLEIIGAEREEFNKNKSLQEIRNERYKPPYDSPLEDSFAWHISKYLGNRTTLAKQVQTATSFGTFFLDFVSRSPSGRRVAFECDGRDFHRDPVRDICRDAVVLDSGAVDAVYRLRGQDLHYHLEDCLYVLARWEPRLFSVTGVYQLSLLASHGVRMLAEDAHCWTGTKLGRGGRELEPEDAEGGWTQLGVPPPGGSWLWIDHQLVLGYSDGERARPCCVIIRQHTWDNMGGEKLRHFLASLCSQRANFDSLVELASKKIRPLIA